VKQRILLIEDERSIADTLVYALETDGFEVLHAATIAAGRSTLESNKNIALIILDAGLPDGNGFELCKEVRRTSDVPVLFLTARNSEIDRIVGLEIGADDYVTKPFSPREVTARVKAILRRKAAQPIETPAAAAQEFAVDTDAIVIRYHSVPLELSPNEYRLLKVLIERPGRVFSREQLMNAAWEDPLSSLERTVDAHIKSIRSKLQAVRPGSDPIVTHRGFGYSLRASNEPAD
jgi:two-component system, OmpR family, catabolic regulation response regulator CreB